MRCVSPLERPKRTSEAASGPINGRCGRSRSQGTPANPVLPSPRSPDSADYSLLYAKTVFDLEQHEMSSGVHENNVGRQFHG